VDVTTIQGWVIAVSAFAAAAGAIWAAFSGFAAYRSARDGLNIEQKRELERDLDRKRAKLAAMVDMSFLRKAQGDQYGVEYHLHVRNFGDSEATAVKLEVARFIRAKAPKEGWVPQEGLEPLETGCLGPQSSFDYALPPNWGECLIEVLIRWSDGVDSQNTRRVQLPIGRRHTYA
jgi:hypothetical protein